MSVSDLSLAQLKAELPGLEALAEEGHAGRDGVLQRGDVDLAELDQRGRLDIRGEGQRRILVAHQRSRAGHDAFEGLDERVDGDV
mgnify:CR=1 FL=1